MKKTPLLKVIFLIGILTISLLPIRISASTTGNQVSFTNNTSYSGNIKLYRVEIQPQTGYTGNTYTYGYYFQTDPSMYGVLSGNFDNNNQDVWSVAVQNGISEMFYSNKTSCYLKSASIVEYNQTLPQEVIDYIANMDSNLELTTELLDKLLLMKQWHFPFESLGIVYPTFEYGFEQVGMIQYNDYDFPIFKIPDNKLIYRTYATNGYKYYWIFMADKNYYSVQLLQNNFTVTNGEITAFKVINRFVQNYNLRYIYKVEVTATASQYLSITYNGGSDMKYMPIYFNDSTYQYISTDFALLFDLSNEFLNNIEIIAQGTSQSQTSVSAADQQNETFSDQASDLVDAEDQMIGNFENALQNVQPSITPSDFGSNFLHSAEWVRDQYNNLVNNTPFASLITFSLVLGVGLLIIGRVLK